VCRCRATPLEADRGPNFRSSPPERIWWDNNSIRSAVPICRRHSDTALRFGRIGGDHRPQTFSRLFVKVDLVLTNRTDQIERLASALSDAQHERWNGKEATKSDCGTAYLDSRRNPACPARHRQLHR
jgi:hypothetical protein